MNRKTNVKLQRSIFPDKIFQLKKKARKLRCPLLSSSVVKPTTQEIRNS